ncbi:AlbA family DNA-binding domain-containing protein [Colwellia sp. E150_009]
MNYKERYNLSTEQIEGIINGYTDVLHPIKLFVTALYTKQEHSTDKGWKFAAGKISSKPVEVVSMNYPKCAFITRELTTTNYEQLFTSLTGEGLHIDSDYPALKKLEKDHWKEQLIPCLLDNKFWPIRRVEVKVSEEVQIPYEKLIGFGLPFFENVGQMIKELADIPEHYVTNSGEKGLLFIDIEDYRGRLQSKGKALSIERSCDVGIVGYYRQNNERTDVIHNEDTPLDFCIEDVEEYELFLVTKQHEVIDFIATNDNLHPSKKSKGADKYRLEIEAAIDSGEGEVVEFKADIDFRDLGSKTVDLEKTVCALSNHRGGKLIFGVNDDGEVKGLATRLKKQYKNDIQGYIADIQKRLNETLSISSCFEINAARIRGQDLVVVEVSKSSRCNAFTADNMVYIRRGASCKKASTSEWDTLNNNNNSQAEYGEFYREYIG